MPELNTLGRSLIVLGLIIVMVGAVLMLGAKLPWFGKLPGDIYIQKKNISVFFPITTSIIISIMLSLIFMLLRRR
jgi:hypothetical protein